MKPPGGFHCFAQSFLEILGNLHSCSLSVWWPGGVYPWSKYTKVRAQWGFAFHFFSVVVARPLVGKGDVRKEPEATAVSIQLSSIMRGCVGVCA